MNGHKFVKRQFFQIILCALCNKFLITADGYQCEDCRYMCHEGCYTKVLTKCISKPNIETVRLFSFSRFSFRSIGRNTCS
jgi:novel protein kinase C epsilon type